VTDEEIRHPSGQVADALDGSRGIGNVDKRDSVRDSVGVEGLGRRFGGCSESP
jgi:hypothetical protein